MADFVDEEAEVSDRTSSEDEGGSASDSSARQVVKKKKKEKKKRKIVDSDDEEEEEDEDEAAIAEEMKDFINEDIEEEGDIEDAEEGEGENKRKHESDEEDDQLEDEDYDLIEENLGIKVKRAKKLKRIRVVSDEEDSDKEGTQAEDAEERIAHELFEGEGEEGEDDLDEVASQRRATERQIEDLHVEGSDEESDIDDFIVDDDGQPIKNKKKKKHIIHSDSLLQEAQDIFGVDFDYEEFKDYGEDESEEEFDEYVDEDAELEGEEGAEGRPKTKKVRPKRAKTAASYEPEALSRAYLTDRDNIIRAEDLPERFQLRGIPVKEADEAEMEEEAEWIYKYAFNSPPVSLQTFLEQESGHHGHYDRYYKKGPNMISKIRKAVDFMRNKHLEVPFIAFYRKEYVEPELDINDLWKVWHFDEKWTQLRTRKLNLIRLFERMQNYQYEQNSDPDKILELNIRTLTEDDVDRVRKVESLEELRDVYNHFLLYYGSDIVKMRNAEKAKKNEEEREKEGEGGTEEEKEHQDTIKQASRKSGYTICVKNKLDEIAMRFGLRPEQFGENIRDNYQRHEVDQCPMEPLQLAEEFVSGQFPTPEEVLLGARHMVAMQLAHDPLVRQIVRQVYFERAKLNVKPTKKGLKLIDEAHPCYSQKYLRNKPVRDLKDEQFLRLVQAEEEGMMTLSIVMDEETDNPNIQSYFEEIRQLYYRDEFSHLVQMWNIQRSQALERALSKLLYPQLEKELRLKLIAEAKEGITKACCRKLYNWLKVAPYQAEQQMGKEDYEEDDTEGVRVLGIAYVQSKEMTGFGALVNSEGEVTDFLRLQNITKRARSFRQQEREEKEKDLEKLREFIETKKPHVIAVTAENHDALMIIEDIKTVITELEQQQEMAPISVELVDNELAMVYEGTQRAEEEFREYPPVLRHAVSIARRIQDPLMEFAQLCNQDEDILCLKYHPMQDVLPKEDLLNALYLEFINRVNEVGVDVNKAVTNPHTAALVQFISGLGPRKGGALLKTLRQSSSRLENRTQLVTLFRMGPKVFINSAGFIKIDTDSFSDSTEAYIEVLDGSRVHPETYEWARKMAVDALEYDDTAEDANPAGALEEILESPERLKDLDLDAFAEELERQGYGDKHITLYDIRAELNHRYKDLRTPYRSPTNEERFNMITKETPDTFYIGKLILVTVRNVVHRKPHVDQLEQADPVRNEESGLWQCPFCNKNDFPELSEVWTHFDEGSCPGSAIGVRCRLDNGCSGFIHIKNLSDKKVTDPMERVKMGMTVHSRIVKIDIDRFQVDLTTRSSDLMDKDNQWKPQKDTYYDFSIEEKEIEKENDKKEQQARQTYIKRVIAHPSFHNIGYKECEKILANMDQGECVIRPSSKGSDHLTVTWKVADGILQHIDIIEQGKENAFSLGKSLLINGEEFEDLDEIIARHIQPMASFARDIFNFKNYRAAEGGRKEIIDKWLSEEKKKAPLRIPYILSAAKQYPGKFLLSYMPRTKARHEYITVNPDGIRYRGNNFHSLNSLMRWFKEHFREPIVGGTPASTRTPAGRTPGLGNTPSFNLQSVDAATIQRAAAGLPSNIYNTLAQVAGVTPTPRITPGFTPGYTPRPGFTPQVGSSGFRPQNPSGMTPMMTPSYTGPGTTPSQPMSTPSYQPTPRSQWPGATPKTPQSTAGSSKPGSSSAGMDWAKAAELWAKQRRNKPGTPRSGQSPGVRPSPRPSPRNPDRSPAGGDSTPLIDER